MSDVRLGTFADAPIPAVAARPAGAVRWGAGAGLVAGAAMALLLVVFSILEGLPALHAFGVIGDTFAGPDPLLGVAVHTAMSAGLGIVLAAIVPRDFPPASSAGVGAGFALFVMGFMVGVVVPPFHAGFVGDLHYIGGTWVAAHAVYGAVLGLVLGRRSRIVQNGPGARRSTTSHPSAA